MLSLMDIRKGEWKMRLPRNGLRPVTAKYFNKTLEGYFHCFCQEGSNDEGIGTYAIVELEDGTVRQLDTCHLKFDDVE
jgi:hypothetical protein